MIFGLETAAAAPDGERIVAVWHESSYTFNAFVSRL
jgi:hypothetical protein